jgi:predicted transcriptional regulator
MGKRKMYNTTLDADLVRELRILAAKLDLRQNDLMEEAIQDLIKKYKNKEASMNVSQG